MPLFDSDKNNVRKVRSCDREMANGEIPCVPNTSLRESMVCIEISAEKVNLKRKITTLIPIYNRGRVGDLVSPASINDIDNTFYKII